MMAQYRKVKEAHPDCLVFFRLGDFYEMFQEDARVAARELDLALTTRDRNKPPEEQTPMCGVPYHTVQTYLSRLTAKGYKVVLCDQMEDPAQAKGLVERDVTRIVTAGTIIDPESLPEDANNFLACLYLEKYWVGLAFCDLSTGETEAFSIRLKEEFQRLLSELDSRRPRELILSPEAKTAFAKSLHGRLSAQEGKVDPAAFAPENAVALIHSQFPHTGEMTFRQPGEMPAAQAVGGLLQYLRDTQCARSLPHMSTISFRRRWDHMELDQPTRVNLELTRNLRDGEKKGSLLWVMDKAKTPMGHRKLRAWLERPLIFAEDINARQEAVALFLKDAPLAADLHAVVDRMGDLERLMARLSLDTGGARELLSLGIALEPMPRFYELISRIDLPIFRTLIQGMDPLKALSEKLRTAFLSLEKLPATVREGGMFAEGYNEEVDRLHQLIDHGEEQLLALEQRERQRTGIRTLRVGYNRVFGYYIEVSNSFKDKVPPEYVRRQTLAGTERYITDELRRLEESFYSARENCQALEYRLFQELRAKVLEKAEVVQKDASAVAVVDVLLAFATLATENRYVRPTVDTSGVLDIVEGRHPVVEQTLASLSTGELFVPNSTHMEPDRECVHLITGPNMAGKSTYMRQIALIVLMAQLGSYVPAQSAHIGVVDRIFTRIGASDNLNGGQSTFMVEMLEVAEILNHATKSSLVVMDEVGRGTSTYDGMAIARGVVEYCAQTVGAKTFFATHYHELLDMEEQYPKIKNFNIAVKKKGGKLTFLRRIVPGGADDSYGIEVAKMAGVPEPVLDKAKVFLRQAEEQTLAAGAEHISQKRARELQDWYAEEEARAQGSSTHVVALPNPVQEELEQVDVNTLSPIEAWQLLSKLQGMVKEVAHGEAS